MKEQTSNKIRETRLIFGKLRELLSQETISSSELIGLVWESEDLFEAILKEQANKGKIARLERENRRLNVQLGDLIDYGNKVNAERDDYKAKFQILYDVGLGKIAKHKQEKSNA